MPKYSCTGIFRSPMMSVHGIESFRDLISAFKSSYGFADDRQFLSDSVTEGFVSQEIRFRSTCNSRSYPVKRLQNVMQPLPITPHRSGELQPILQDECAASVQA